MDDSEIISLYWNRDETAIRETEKKYGDYCFGIANRILMDYEDTEEVVSDTYMRAWNTIPPNRPARLRLFLARLTRNLALDRYRERTALKRGGGEMEVALEELAQCVPSPARTEDGVELDELKRAIEEFLEAIPETHRYIFTRRYFFLDTTEDLSERFSMKENNVLLILSRTRKKLRLHLRKEGYEL